MALKADAAELVVDGPFPCCIGVTVEDDAALDFARALLDSGDIVTDLLGKRKSTSLIYAPNCISAIKGQIR